MQYIWRLGATLVAAIIFFACAAMVFLRKEPKATPARAKVTALKLAPVAAATMSLEAQRLWAEHERWLQQATPRARAA
jgi:hypothetical protein